MRHVKILSFAAMFCMSAGALAAEPISGHWITEDGKALVTIGRCGNTVCGRVTRILATAPKDPPVDENNPDKTLRHRPILGLTVLSGFTDKGDDWRGKIYSPEEGKSYRSIIERDGPNRLKVKGCIAFFCKTQHWKRAR